MKYSEKQLFFVIVSILFLTNIGLGQYLPEKLTSESIPVFKEKPTTFQPLQLHPEYDVLLYDINITIDPDNQLIRAETSIQIKITIEMQDYLLFDFAGLQLDSVFLNSERVPGVIEDGILAIDLETPLMVGDSHRVNVYYQGHPERGIYFRLNRYDDMVIYSHNEPYDARFWFPCKDDPSDKAKLLMKVTIPDQFIVLSNGTFIGQGDAGENFTQFIWQEDYPIATYLISIAAGSYLITDTIYNWQGEDLLLEYYVYPTDLSRGADALNLVIEMLDFYNPYIGEYPFFTDKYSMSEVPFREATAMENQTATTMGDFAMDNEEVIAHELAHQWWGDALTPQSFVDIWLNEGFATYFDALFTEYKYGEEAFWERMNNFYNYVVSDVSLAYPIYNPPPEYLFGRAVYMKGAWVLHMLRIEVGDQIFNEIIRQYYNDYNYSSVITGLFITIVESVSGRSFDTFFDQWLNYGGMPLLIGSWEQNNNIVNLTVRQDQPEPVYEFDLEVLVEGASTDTLIVLPVLDLESQKTITFAEPVVRMTIDPYKKIFHTNNSPVHYIPTQTGLVWLYPNPFHETISITYQLEKTEKVEIIIYDILGQIVDKLIDEKKTIGVHQVDWDGRMYASGTYYCTLTTKSNSDVQKMTLVK
jgi:aminopeptidase N